MIELAKFDELETITNLAKKTRENMLNSGLHQWLGDYPNYNNFLIDFKKNALFVFKENNIIIASASLLPENDEAYKEIKWIKSNSLVMHRILVDPDVQKKGIGMKIFDFTKSIAIKQGYESIKVDTHPDNYKMQGLILKAKFEKMGYLSGINRLAYEYVLC